MNQDEHETCNVYTQKMLQLLDYEQYLIKCDHRTLAVVTVNTVDKCFQVSLLLENKTVFWQWSRGRVHIVDSGELG